MKVVSLSSAGYELFVAGDDVNPSRVALSRKSLCDQLGRAVRTSRIAASCAD